MFQEQNTSEVSYGTWWSELGTHAGLLLNHNGSFSDDIGEWLWNIVVFDWSILFEVAGPWCPNRVSLHFSSCTTMVERDEHTIPRLGTLCYISGTAASSTAPLWSA
jgi:hypothetical protein